MTDGVIDQKARDMASEGLAKIAASEQMNAERWRQVEKAISTLDGSLKALNGRVTTWVISSLVSLVFLLIGIIGWMTVQLYTGLKP